MKLFDTVAARVDDFQQSHPWAAFPYAVIRKYGDDNAANHGALITYYAFLSLFPLLLAATAALQLVFRHNTHLQTSIVVHIDNYFPIIGSQLHQNITSIGKTGLALVVSILIAFYGARGAADALRHTLDVMWEVPKRHQASFPKSTVRSLAMIATGGLTLLGTAFLSSYATSFGHAAFFKIGFTLVSLVLFIFGLFVVQRLGLSTAVSGKRQLLWTATLASVGFQILQTYGGYLMNHQLHHADNAYGVFSITLALLFWIYLQVEVLLYAVEITVVRARHLWPRRMR